MQNPQLQNQNTFENRLAQRLFTTPLQDKSHTDKLLGRAEIEKIQNLIKKDDLERSELLEMLYLLSSSEIKLANFGDYDRYLLGKFLAWIRDFVSICEILYDYKEEYDNIEKDGDENDKSYLDKKDIRKLMENNRKYMLHNVKFLVDIFLYLSRSTLSLSMNAFEILTTSKYEYAYSDPGNVLKPSDEGTKNPLKLILRG